MIRRDMLWFYFLMALLTTFVQSYKNICAFLISFWIFAIICKWRYNEVKCVIIKIQNANVADDCEWA